MKKIIIFAGLISASVLTAAAQERRPRPLPAAGASSSATAAAASAALLMQASSCAELTSQEREELSQALELVKGNSAPSAVLAKLITTRPELQATSEQLKEWRESLPAAFKTRLLTASEVTGNAANSRALAVARRVADEFGFKNRFLMFYQSDKPLLATWKEHFVLVSTKAVELLSPAELAGQIAHETAHLFYLDELKKAIATNDYKTARIIELRCDLLAAMMLERLKLDSSAVATGLAVMSDWLSAHNQIKPVQTHPGLCARLKLAQEFARTLKSNSVALPSATKPASPQETGTLYLAARIYYGENDEKITFVGRESFILLDESLVAILQKNNFRIGAESNSDASPSLSQTAQANKEIGHRSRSTPGHKNRRVRKNPRAKQIAAAIDQQGAFDARQNAYLAAAVNLLEEKVKGALTEAGGAADEERALLRLLFEEAIKTHRIAAGETNEWGMNVFTHLKPGRYYLFGFARTELETLVWHLPLLIKSGNNQVELDQYNTSFVLEN